MDGARPRDKAPAQAVRIPDLARRLSISPRLAFRMVQEGVVRSVRVGRCVLIPVSEIERFLAGDGNV
jgi:excisionase family DNA binding protein